jgi:hypothetical protein
VGFPAVLRTGRLPYRDGEPRESPPRLPARVCGLHPRPRVYRFRLVFATGNVLVSSFRKQGTCAGESDSGSRYRVSCCAARPKVLSIVKTSGQFATRFEQLTGHQPYPWQIRLFESLVVGHIPHNLGAPTGAGKTNVIACWVLALVENRDLPRRLVYVVDRRSVVDQSTKVVEEMYAKIEADASMAASLNLTEGLGISTLRGEYADNQEWSHLPHRPSVVCGTVDMVGSRLLFSGYGDGAYSRSKAWRS